MIHIAYRHLATAYTYNLERRTDKLSAIIVGELEQCIRSTPDTLQALKEDIRSLQKDVIDNRPCQWHTVLTVMQSMCTKEATDASTYDVFIPLRANGSYSNNIELLYALRSIYTNLIGYRYIWIVGSQLPSWVVGVKFIQQEDRYQGKQMNIHTAILSAMQNAECADNLIFWADDNVLLHKLDVHDIPAVSMNSDLLDCNDDSVWWDRTRKITGHVLQEAGLPTIDYEAHTPVVFNKEKYLRLSTEFNYYANSDGLCYISMYLNRYTPSHIKNVSDIKTTWTDTSNTIDNMTFMGYSDTGIANKITTVLHKEFPHASVHEHLPQSPYKDTVNVGAVLGVSDRPDLVELQLYYLCHINNLPVLVHNDTDGQDADTRAVIDSYINKGYDVSYMRTDTRLGHLQGDINAVVEGLAWANRRNIDLLFKVSARLVVTAEWANDLRALASNTDALTLSSYSTSYNKGFRSEFFGMHVASWFTFYDTLKSYTKQQSDGRTINGRTVERILHIIAMSLAKTHGTYTYMYKMSEQGIDKHKQGYILIPVMGTDRKKPPEGVLWHDAYTHEEEPRVYSEALNKIRGN